MHKKILTRGLPNVKQSKGVCSFCQMGKQHRMLFPNASTWRTKERLELVHTDVYGPMNDEFLSKNRYFVLFINDLIKMTWIYFMSH